MQDIFAKVMAWFSVCLLLLALPSIAGAGELQVEYSIGPEPTTFSQFDVGENLGFVDEPIWFRFDLSSFEDLNSHVLIVRPVHIDRASLFAGANLASSIYEFGDTVYSPKGVVSDGYSFVLGNRWQGEPLYLRLSSKNVIQPHFIVQPIDEAIQFSKILMLTIGSVLAITFGYLAWAISSAVSSPSPLVSMFVVRLVLFLVTLGVHSGVMRDVLSSTVLPPQDLAHNLTALVYVTVAQLFDWLLLKTVVQSVFTRILLGLVLTFSAFKFAAFVSGSVSTALLINNMSALLVLLVGSGVAIAHMFMKKGSQKAEARLVSAYFVVQFAPLLALVLLTVMQSTKYLFVFDLMFFSYAVVPGGIVIWLLYLRQRAARAFAQRVSLDAKLMTQRSEEEFAKRKEIADLMSMLTHEIRTPLATLQMAGALGEVDSRLVNSAAHSIASVLRQADRAEDIELGQLDVQLDAVSLRDVLDEAARDFDVKITYSNDAALVKADLGFLRVIVSNLIGNAQKYGLANAPISVEFAELNGCVVASITNQTRRSPGDLAVLFEKYKRGNNASNQSGSGVGLFIARALGLKMGITLDAQATGSTFTVTLTAPLASDNMNAQRGDQ